MGIILLAVLAVYLLIVVILFVIVGKFTKKKYAIILVIILLIAPFTRTILIKSLFYHYSQTPLSEIHETVEEPISVYWEDNASGGLNGLHRRLNVDIYLDGRHLKLLVLKGSDGKYYSYRANENDRKKSFDISSRMKPLKRDRALLEEKKYRIPRQKIKDHPVMQKISSIDIELTKLHKQYRDAKHEENIVIINNAKSYRQMSEIPSVNYLIKIDPLPTGTFINSNFFHLIYADRISIIDMRENIEIAYSKRYMAYKGFWGQFTDIPGKFSPVIGEDSVMYFSNSVLFGYLRY